MFKKGDLLVVSSTGEKVIFISFDDEDLCFVSLDDGTIIPIDSNNLQVYSNRTISTDLYDQFPIFESSRSDLVFILDIREENEISYIELLIENSLDSVFLSEFYLRSPAYKGARKRIEIPKNMVVSIFKKPLDLINERPVLEYKLWEKKKMGTGRLIDGELKVTPKKVFGKKIFNDNLYKEVIEIVINRKPKEKIQKINLVYKEKNNDNLFYKLIASPELVASFNPEIDLHIECLRDDFRLVDPKQYLPIQLNAMIKYVEEAIRLGVEKVYIIHGVGDGVLKRAIHRRLNENPYVEQYANLYNPKYGLGATEVFFY